jgi:molybdate transport system substrate-binding protein
MITTSQTHFLQTFSSIIAAALLVALASCSSDKRPAEREIIVAAASDLGPAFEELGRLFEQKTGTKVTFSFGSTGQLAEQIEHGAPVDLFAAANISFVERLNQKGLIFPDTLALYARGRIALWTRKDSTLRIESVKDLASDQVRRIAIANPEHAPYGVAARESLEASQIYEQVKSRLVFGENVRQALQFAETGNADVAIAALSLSLLSDGRWVIVPDDLHRPLDQALAVLRRTTREREARQFASFINEPEGRTVMRKYGFILPGEEPLH